MKFKGYFASVGLLLAAGAPVEADLVWAYVGAANGGSSVAIWNPQDTSMADDTVTYALPPNAARGRWSVAPPVQTPGAYPASYTANPYLSQATWFIDGTANGAGNDLNDGMTAATPLQTFGEVVRRWGPNPVLRQATTVTFLSTNVVASDWMQLRGIAAMLASQTLTINGFVAAGSTLGNISAVSAINHSVADAALYVTIGAITWPAQHTRVRISGGARDGAVAYVVAANTAAGQSRLSPFATDGVIPTLVTPQVGDTLIVETTTQFQNPIELAASPIRLIAKDIEFLDAGATGQRLQGNSSTNLSRFSRCFFHGAGHCENNIFFNNCQIASSGWFNSGPEVCFMYAGFLDSSGGGAGLEGYWQVDFDLMIDGGGTGGGLNSNYGYQALSGNLMVYNSDGAINAIVGSSFIIAPIFGTASLCGTGNTFTYIVTGGSTIRVTDPSVIKIVGTTAFAQYAGVNSSAALYPIDNHGNSVVTIDTGTSGGGPEVSNNTYRTAVVRTARNVSLSNQNTTSFTVAGNDGVTNIEDDIVVLMAQTTASQNGPWVVGIVTAGSAPLTRPDWWQHGLVMPQAFQIAISAESTVYGGSTLKSDVSTASKVVDTDDPLFTPDRIVQSVQLNNGTIDISNVPIRNAAKVAITASRVTPSGTASTIQYNPSTITAGSLGGGGAPKVTVQAQIAAGTINVADGSTLQVAIIQQ